MQQKHYFHRIEVKMLSGAEILIHFSSDFNWCAHSPTYTLTHVDTKRSSLTPSNKNTDWQTTCMRSFHQQNLYRLFRYVFPFGLPFFVRLFALSLFLSLFIFYERRETIKYSWEKLHYVFWYGCHLKANKKIEHSYNNSIKKRIQQNRTETFYVIKTKIEQSFLHACVYVSLCLSHRALSHETWKKKQHEKKEAPRK